MPKTNGTFSLASQFNLKIILMWKITGCHSRASERGEPGAYGVPRPHVLLSRRLCKDVRVGLGRGGVNSKTGLFSLVFNTLLLFP